LVQAIFNELLKGFGVTVAHVQEIYALDEDSLRALGYSSPSFSAKFTANGANPNCSPVHGMIFLFRWKPEPMESAEDTCPENVWFANQVGLMLPQAL